MAENQSIAQVHQSALSDPYISPQAVALAATMITGGDPLKLGMGEHNTELATWELSRAGHIGGGMQ